MYEYRVKIERVIDGDTVDVDIDLGFGVQLNDERVRIMGIDTPESRTSDKVEKVFGKAAKAALISMLGETSVLKTQINRDGEDMKGKFGRILGDFIVDRNGEPMSVVQALVEDGHAVPYFGGSKDDTLSQHMINRKRLIDEGIVEMSYEEAGIEVEPEPEVVEPVPGTEEPEIFVQEEVVVQASVEDMTSNDPVVLDQFKPKD